MRRKGKINKEENELNGIKAQIKKQKKKIIKSEDAKSEISVKEDVEMEIEKKPEIIAQKDARDLDKDDGCKEKEQEIKDWKKDYDGLYDKYLRMYSEFENFRRRTNKEKFELIDRANATLILDLLGVIDDFERALLSFKDSNDINEVKEGVKLIYYKLKKNLEDKGLKEMECIGNDFDPELHEAISKIPAPKKKLKGKIVDQIQKGYFLKDNVLRYSQVIVGE